MSERRFIMSEKRFSLDDESRIWDNGTPMTALDIVVMLNEQQEEIERLKKELDKIEKLQRSKAYWKKQCKEWEKNWGDLAYEFARVNNMNKELSKDLED